MHGPDPRRLSPPSANLRPDKLGHYADAEPLYKRSLAAREKALGPDHPYVALSLTNLAELYARQGRLAEAAPLYERALQIRETALGPNHPRVATSMEGYATLLRKTDRNDEAVELETRARAIRAKRAE